MTLSGTRGLGVAKHPVPNDLQVPVNGHGGGIQVYVHFKSKVNALSLSNNIDEQVGFASGNVSETPAVDGAGPAVLGDDDVPNPGTAEGLLNRLVERPGSTEVVHIDPE